jgi:hypothetical protein
VTQTRTQATSSPLTIRLNEQSGTLDGFLADTATRLSFEMIG